MGYIKVKSPGRINLIGEHVDYINGVSMPVAIDLYNFIEIEQIYSAKQVLIISSDNFNEEYSIDFNDIYKYRDNYNDYIYKKKIGSWVKYPVSLFLVLQKYGIILNHL